MPIARLGLAVYGLNPMRIIRTEKTFPDSKWTKYLSLNARLRAVHCEVESVAQELIDRHGLRETAAQKMAEAVVAAILNSSLHDDGEDINLKLVDSRSRLSVVVDARPEGAVRGLINFAPDSADLKDSLAVIYSQNREGQTPYLGVTETVSVKIDENLDNYFRQSVQIPTNTGIQVEVSGSKVKLARGMLVQIIGGASPEDVQAVLGSDREAIRKLATRFDENFGENLVGVGFRKIEERELSTFCTCSQEKLEDALKMSAPGENEPETLEADCDFCRKRYIIETAKIWP